MPYNTTAIPPRKEPTGHTQLPLSRVKRIVALDPEINVCSNNASFVITLAAELFVQYLAREAQNMAKMERKPRRNLQYKDLANAVLHKDNLEFLEDVVPRTAVYKDIKDKSTATQAKLRGEKPGGAAAAAEEEEEGGQAQNGLVTAMGEEEEEDNEGDDATAPQQPNGKRLKLSINGSSGRKGGVATNGVASGRTVVVADEDPNAQLEAEMREAERHQQDDDIIMLD